MDTSSTSSSQPAIERSNGDAGASESKSEPQYAEIVVRYKSPGIPTVPLHLLDELLGGLRDKTYYHRNEPTADMARYATELHERLIAATAEFIVGVMHGASHWKLTGAERSALRSDLVEHLGREL